jgi:predicted PurR-regulated permease PerM
VGFVVDGRGGEPPATAPAPTPRWGEYVGLSAGSAVLLVGAALTAWLLRGMFATSHRTFGWVVACAVVALLIDPVVALVDRYAPRVVAVLAVLVAVLAFVAVVGVAVAREVIDSLDELAAEAPAAAAELESTYAWAADLELERRVTTAVDQIDARVREGAVAEAADSLPTYLVTAILMLFLLAGGRRYLDGFLDQFGEPRRSRWRHVIVTAGRRGRTWILGSLGQGVLIGALVSGCAWALDLPAAVSLGVLVGAASVLPLIGVLVGGVPAVLLAFGLEGWRAGALVAALLVALQIVDAAMVRPAIEARSVRVGPAVPAIVGLLGFELYGFGGSIYAIALAVIGLAALDAAGQDSDAMSVDEEVEERVDDRPAPAPTTLA